MKIQLLDGIWELHEFGKETGIPASVPGTVYGAYLAEGKMEDPFWKDNENKATDMMKKDYVYSCRFDAEEEVRNSGRVELLFEGIDTIGEVLLNGEKLGDPCNMYREWRYEVKDLLKEKENYLEVILHSPINYIREEYAKCRCDGSEDAMRGFPHIRKAHYMFGWDWGPHLPDAGIWKSVKLAGEDHARIDSVYIRQYHENGRVGLKLEIEEIKYRDCGISYSAEVIAPDGTVQKWTDVSEILWVDQPNLWWPRGYGNQPLYVVKVRQMVNGAVEDQFEKRIGLRTMTMHVEKDQWGHCFAHQVNGIDCFAMGADYIPEDNLIGRTSREKTYQLLKQCADANFNTIRVWGGGYYPNDWFFDICDELGLMVWQDFMFACAVYELTEEFEENITAEIIENVKRIRNHACLGLWCGNNEMEMFVKEGNWVSRESQRADYIKMYEYIIPKLLKKYDPDTFYWPASPSSGGSFDDPNGADSGDVHYWNVWHGNEPFTEYRKYFFRYISEFGFQSFPSVKTIETFTDDPRDKNIFSYIMEKHQRNNSANGKIMNYLQQTYLYPGDFETLIYASQLLQADAIRYGVEHFRRNRGRCMGAIYWQVNDCWPVTSWASIDYCGRWKALHYSAKRFFAPVLLSCEEEGMLTQNTNVNSEDFVIQPSIRLNVSNESREDQETIVRWYLRKNTGEILKKGEEQLNVPALKSVWCEKMLFPEADIYTEYVSFELWIGGEKKSDGTVIFSVPKYFRFMNPELDVRLDGEEIVVKAGAYAKNVEILNDTEDLILSDNYFDLNGDEKRVRILSGEPNGLRVRSVYDIR